VIRASQGAGLPASARARRGCAWLLSSLVACAALPAAADDAPWEGRSAVASAGAVKPEGLGYGPWLAIAFSHKLGPLHIEPELGFWSRSETAFGLRATASDLHLGLNVAATLAHVAATRVLAAAGAAAHRVENAAQSGTAKASVTETRPGLMAMVGLERRVAHRLSMLAAARYDRIFETDLEAHEWRFFAAARLAF